MKNSCLRIFAKQLRYMILFLGLLAASLGSAILVEAQSIPGNNTNTLTGSNKLQQNNAIKESSISGAKDCIPNSWWTWTKGSFEPDIEIQVQQELSQLEIKSIIEARSYGEIDDCSTYNHRGIDFTINLVNNESTQLLSEEKYAENILPILVEFGKPKLGNVKFFSPQGDLLPINNKSKTFFEVESSNTEMLNAELLPPDAITRNVYVIVYDPLLGNGQKLSQYLGWHDHAVITQQTLDFFSQTTNSKMNYVVVNTTIVTSGWPELVDGFSYTESEYLAVLAGQQPHHEPTQVNYNKIVNSPAFDICGKLNRGEIDEVWIYNGPWFGFYESTLVGPGAYQFNSPPVGGTHNCNKLLPIMGPSPERTVDEAVHNFTHRAEATMTKVYGSWQENNTSHNWNKFALVKAQSPNYSYSGCGTSHYPPNGTSDYNYGNSSSVSSNCNDFANYPNLGDPLTVSLPVTCSTWGCTQLGYFGYWFGHFPAFPGCGPDNVANDWWKYLASPAYALYPSYACQTDMHWISGNVGTGGAILNYTDSTSKTVSADANGNYSLLVSNSWSGIVTPSKLGYAFTPSSKDYVDVQSNLYSQNYTAQGNAPTAYYVNSATGNNNNTCITVSAPCRNIQEAVNKAGTGNTVYVTSGNYLFSTNPTPNVVIIDKNLTLSGGWNSSFTLQNGASIIDGANTNNGILAISGNVVVENFIIRRSISYNGGTIYIVNGNFTLKKSTLWNNVATSNGAGIFLDNGTLTIINSTISGNTANGSGGGIYTSSNSGTSITIQNSTIAYNHASTGGGISRTNGTFNITNTIIANNSSSISSPDCAGTIAVAKFNIIENTTGCLITSGTNNLNTDPQIDSNLTGVTLVHMLPAGSPAIDAGDDVTCPVTDQRGVARPQGNHCDVGAYEAEQGALNPDQSSIDFGDQLYYTKSDPTTVTLTNLQATNVHMGSFQRSSGQFILSNNNCAGATLTPAQSCTFNLQFKPTAYGALSGTLTINSDAVNNPVVISLDAVGLPGTQLVTKGGSFEQDNNNDTIPDFWTTSGLSGLDGRSSQYAKHGTYSMKIVGQSGMTKTLKQTIVQNGSAGDDFLYVLWSKAQTVPSGFKYRTQVSFYNGTSLVERRIKDYTSGTHDWEYRWLPITVSGNYTRIEVEIIYSLASGTVWFDSDSLKWAP